MSIRDISFSGGDFMRFIGRTFELKELEEEYGKGKFALSVIYGRRRVGKTYLIKEFLKRKDGYYFVALESNALINLSLLSQAIYEACGNLKGLPDFQDFEAALRYLFAYGEEQALLDFVRLFYEFYGKSGTGLQKSALRTTDKPVKGSALWIFGSGRVCRFL